MSAITNFTIFKNAVKMLERKEFGQDDFADLEYYISSRYGVVRKDLNEDESRELVFLDMEFRKLLLPALSKANLLEWYQKTALKYPPQDWWWKINAS